MRFAMATDFLPAIVELLKECFEGMPEGQNYTWFVQGKEGLFDAFESIDAARASIKPNPDCPSIAAHTYHIRFALRGANGDIRGEENEGTWESSWDKQSVTEEEWRDLIASVREEYAFFLGIMSNGPEILEGDAVIGSLAMLPHMAYHLGAIRQLMKVT
jgi:hypothetical protein